MRFIICMFFYIFFNSTIIFAFNIFENTLEKNVYISNHDTNIGYENITQYFHLSLKDASKELRISVSLLKKICRKNNLKRWPYRKIQSLNGLIDYYDSMKDEAKVKVYRDKKDQLLKNPNLRLEELITKTELNSINAKMKNLNIKPKRDCPSNKTHSNKQSCVALPPPWVPIFQVSSPYKNCNKIPRPFFTTLPSFTNVEEKENNSGNMAEFQEENMDQSSDREETGEQSEEMREDINLMGTDGVNQFEKNQEENMDQSSDCEETGVQSEEMREDINLMSTDGVNQDQDKNYEETSAFEQNCMDESTWNEFREIKQRCQHLINYKRLF